MMSNPDKRPVTVEDLLRLKRAERPSPEFWARFESELRAKQLAAIVEKRPWWQSFSLAGLARHRLSLGATAVLALSVFSVVEYRSRTENGSASNLPEIASKSSEPVSMPAIPAAPAVVVSEVTVAAPVTVSYPLSPSSEAYAAAGESSDLIAADLAAKTNEVASAWTLVADDVGPREFSPTGRLIAENLASAKEVHPEFANRFFAVSGFEKRGLPATRQSVDPLAQMRNPAELHRERLLASAASASLSSSVRTSDRPARRLSDRRLTEDAVSRFDARGSEFSLKF